MFLVLPTLCAGAWADEASDRTAIARTIATLNQVPQRVEVFTADSDAGPVIDDLAKGKRVTFQLHPPVQDGRMVTISHEPMGEATLNFPGVPAIPTVELLNPRIESAGVRFIGADVALAEGSWIWQDSAGVQTTTPLVFVMKRDSEVWKIASVVVRAPR